MKIAFFDSGLGGLGVLHAAMKRLPKEEFLFYADEDHVPYGTKSNEDILRFVDDAFAFLAGQGADAVVVACNTATSVAVKAMREKYSFPVIGMEPAVKPALDAKGNKRVLVVATNVTVKGEKLHNLLAKIDPDGRVDRLPLQKLVDFAEEFQFAAAKEYIKEQFAPFDFAKYSALVLGCTHFNYFKDSFRELLPEGVAIFDGNDGTVRELARRLGIEAETGETSPPKKTPKYFYSGREVTEAAEIMRLNRYLKRLNEMYLIN